MNILSLDQAVFHDGTENFTAPDTPRAGDEVTFRLRLPAWIFDEDGVKVRLVAEEGNASFEALLRHRECVHLPRWEIPMRLCAPKSRPCQAPMANAEEKAQRQGNGQSFIRKEEAPAVFAYAMAHVRLGQLPFHYYFEIDIGKERHTYSAYGLDGENPAKNVFCLLPGVALPDWAKGAVMYHIFADRFCNGNKANDVQTGEYIYMGKPVRRVDAWEELPESLDVGNFHGGDLDGIRQKFSYLQALGVEVLYISPLFLSPSNHKYDTGDYDVVDPHFTVGIYGSLAQDPKAKVTPPFALNEPESAGELSFLAQETAEASNAHFADFIKDAHRAGFRVILDGVFNHCGSFHRWMDREGLYERAAKEQGKHVPPGAYCSKESPYRSFFCFEDENAWPQNDSYEKWWDVPTLPKLNYEGSEALCEEILRIGRKWVSPPYNADGWRLDVAADLGHGAPFNHAFWQRFRKEVKKANPQALVLAEHYGEASSWLKKGDWDTVMNYDGFMDPVSFFFSGMEKHSDAKEADLLGDVKAFALSMKKARGSFPQGAFLAAMNELSNHDHSRFLTRTNGRCARAGKEDTAGEGIDKGLFAEAVLMQMTWPGAPTIYYGDEAGLCGYTDPDSRRAYPWGHEDAELLAMHRAWVSLHKKSRALTRGSCVLLSVSDEAGSEDKLLSYGRFLKEEKAVVVFNQRNEPCCVRVLVAAGNIQEGERLTLAGLAGHLEDGRIYEAFESDGNFFCDGEKETPQALLKDSEQERRFTVKDGVLAATLPAGSGAVFLL